MICIYLNKKTGEVIARGPSGMCSLTYKLLAVINEKET